MRRIRHRKILRIAGGGGRHIVALYASDEPPKPPEPPPKPPEEPFQSPLPEALRTLSARISSLHVQVVLDMALEVAQHMTCAALDVEPRVLYKLIDRHLQGLRGVPVRLRAGARAYEALMRDDSLLLKDVVGSITRENFDDPWAVRLEVPPNGHIDLGPQAQTDAVKRVWFPGDDSF